ncbi:potassium channel family protein [Desulforegula conservatrix]|uniref:potassium channel family protein n=1 Tax=Desulforegula conservatrix TaxID=153026 RepID=UPI00041D777D|nr:potassium channel family protein [Desulforegula conservatrix]
MKLFSLLSPTWAIADFVKKKYDRTTVIEVLNSFYLYLSVVSVVGVLVFQKYWASQENTSISNALSYAVVYIWSYLLLSRCHEIFWAFLRDAFDKLGDPEDKKSRLGPKDRVRLALKSYLELVLNFSLLYALVPATEGMWSSKKFPIQITDAMYFSGVTITTLGYGDFSPGHWYPQFLTVYEVFCGFILLIVCFTIYSGIRSPNKNDYE